MNFKQINEKEYEKFWKKYKYKTFLSSPRIGNLREIANFKKVFFGLFVNKNLVASCMLLSFENKLGYKSFYSPRGILIDYSNLIYLTYFIKELKKYIKINKGYILKIDPYIEYIQRDNCGKPVGNPNYKILNNLKLLQFKKSKNDEQVKWYMDLPLGNKDINQIYNEFTSTTKSSIKKNINSNIKIQKCKYEELQRFDNIMQSTSKRRDFKVRDLSYYQNMYILFNKEVKFLISSLDLREYKENLLIKKNNYINNYNSTNNNKRKHNLKNEITIINNKIIKTNNLIKKYGQYADLSCGMFVGTYPEMIYLAGGTNEDFLFLSSEYLLQWEMIKYAKEKGYKTYNFYGINDLEKSTENYGLYTFKKGFNANVHELIGSYHLKIYPNFLINKMLMFFKNKFCK